MSYDSKKGISEDDIKNCLRRSGYLMESLLVRQITKAGFEVYPNQTLVDMQTGKSREIDMIIYSEAVDSKLMLDVRTEVVVEAINNPYPVIFMTEDGNQPGESLLFKITDDGSGRMTMAARRLVDNGIHRIKWLRMHTAYSQYCCITEKGKAKGDAQEYMAVHSDDFHSTITKVIQYILQSIRLLENSSLPSDLMNRMWFWRPVIVLDKDIYVATVSQDSGIEIMKTERVQFLHNWHDVNESVFAHAFHTTIIDVVTKDFLLPFLQEIAQEDSTVLDIIQKEFQKN